MPMKAIGRTLQRLSRIPVDPASIHISGSHCERRRRLLGFLWPVRCGGALMVRPSGLYAGRNYTVCQECGGVDWPERTQ